jgi:hypothetical protein
MLVFECNVEAAEVLDELRLLARAEDRDDGGRASEQPGECDLGWRGVEFLGNGDDRAHDTFCSSVGIVAGAGAEAAVRVGSVEVLSGQHSASERRPGGDAKPECVRHR